MLKFSYCLCALFVVVAVLVIRIPESEIHACVLRLFWNKESWALEFGLQLKESGILLRIGIPNRSSTDKYCGLHYLESRIQNPRLA